MNINIIGVPIFYGCDKKGVDLAPDILREKGLVEILSKGNNKVFDSGNLYVPSTNEDEKYINHNNMKYLSPIIKTNENLAHSVYTSLKIGDFPFVVGGDHSLGLGSVSGASKYFGNNLAVIWIDAHGDINTHETSFSGNVHGMPLAGAMGIGHNLLTDLYYEGQKVSPENVFIIGARDLDKGETELIDKHNISVYSVEDARNKGIENMLKEIYDKLDKNSIDNIHISYDIDSIDSSIVPGTGTPVGKGFNVEEIKTMFTSIFNTRKVKSMDFVELNTSLEENGENTLNVCIDLISHLAKLI